LNAGELWQALRFAFDITGPILLLLAVGSGARRLGLIDAPFVARANALVYNVALPTMLYFAIATRPLTEAFDGTLIAIGVGGTLLLIALAMLVGRLLPPDQRGVFVQGSYRGNLAILGVALAVATFGDDVLPLVAVYIAIVTTMYNLVAVPLLMLGSGRAPDDAPGRHPLAEIARNPILIGILAGVLGSLLELPAPTVLVSTGGYLAALTLPLALICIGANLQIASIRQHVRSLLLATLFKLVLSPLLLVGMGLAAGLDGTRIGVLFFLAASPTASASFVMASRLTRHGALAAEIIAITTGLGVLVYTAGLALLQANGVLPGLA